MRTGASLAWIWRVLINSRLIWTWFVILVVYLILHFTDPYNSQTSSSPVRKIVDSKLLYNRVNFKVLPIISENIEDSKKNWEDAKSNYSVVSKTIFRKSEGDSYVSEYIDGFQKNSNINLSMGIKNWRNLSKFEINDLSIVGRRLFLHENIGIVSSQNFTILVWKHGPTIERRLIKRYGKTKKDPFERCSVNNCIITYEDNMLTKADAVLFHLHRMKGPPSDVPRPWPDQLWVWLTDENPYHMFMSAKDKNISHYNNYFNWSMHYRMDADIPVPYGRTIPLKEELKINLDSIYDSKNRTIAVLASNCGGTNKRYSYVKKLQEYLQVDFYGGCGTLKCPGHFTKDCTVLKDYLFYISFENGNCKQYITEKVFWNALAKEAVPVVMGSPRQQYEQILPPNSFIHVDDFNCIKDLANYIKYLTNNRRHYNKYHSWRRKFQVVNEHGYFGTHNFHYCRLCEALNYNSIKTKTYSDLYHYWNKIDYCYPPTWIEREKICESV